MFAANAVIMHYFFNWGRNNVKDVPHFWNMLFIVLTHSMSMVVALMLNGLSKRSVKTYQTVFFFPYFISWVIAAYLGLALFSGDKGLMNQLMVLYTYALQLRFYCRSILCRISRLFTL